MDGYNVFTIGKTEPRTLGSVTVSGPARNRAERRERYDLLDTKPKRLKTDAKRKRQAQKAARKKQRR